jgi:hypothetical protein
MKRTCSVILLFLLGISISQAQIEVGLKHNLDGIPLNGYFDPMIFSSEKTVYFSPEPNTFEQGYYTDINGNIIKGLILFHSQGISFKKNEADKKVLIERANIKNIIIGIDSFITVPSKNIKEIYNNEPQFIQYITSFDNYIFAKHYHFFSNFSNNVAGTNSSTSESYIVKHKDSLIWDKFSRDRDIFKIQALKYFGHIQNIKDKLIANKYSQEDMASIIKMAEYYNKFKNSEPIYFDDYWQEIQNANKAVYTAKVLAFNNEVWELEYSNKTNKIYKAKYSSFAPNEKEGEFITYYPNGSIREVIFYVKNNPSEVKLYNQLGVMTQNYKLVKGKETLWSTAPKVILTYLTMQDSLGNDILKSNPNATLNIFDEFSHETYTYQFENSKIKFCYRLINSDTIFNTTKYDYNFDDTKLQEKFNTFFKDKKYHDAMSVNAQGTILVSVIMDDNGYAKKYQLLNKLHPQLDSLVEQFVISKLLPTDKKAIQLKPYRINGKAKTCEILIPFEFSINRFYREPVNYMQFNQPFYNIHHQINQQNMMRNYGAPTMRMGF